MSILLGTYSRYERAPEGPDCGIPLPAAWAMADKLGCSIDLVVGREDIDVPRRPRSMPVRANSAVPVVRCSMISCATSSFATLP